MNLTGVETCDDNVIDEVEDVGNHDQHINVDLSQFNNMVYEGMVCDSEEDAFKKYNEFARKVGFSVCKDKIYRRAYGSTRSKMFVCFKQGLRKEDKRCKNTTMVRNESRTDCKTRMIIKNEEDEWTVSKIVYEHNHVLATPSKAYMLRSQRKVKDVHLAEIGSLNATGITPVKGFNYMVHQAGAHLMYTIEERDVDGSIFRYEVGRKGRRKNIVMIDSSNIQVGCTCNKFEFTGIICRHIVKVFYHRIIHEIPSKYILARWTKDVKAGIVRDEVGKTTLANCNTSLSLRYNELCAQAIKITTKGAINEEPRPALVAMRVLKNGLEEVELATGLPHKDSVENPKSTKANASQSDKVKVKEILTVAQGCERGCPPRTRLKSGLELSQKKKKSKTTRTDSSNSNVRKHHTSPQQNEDLRQCDTMLTEATCSKKNVHLSKSNARKHPTSPHQNEGLKVEHFMEQPRPYICPSFAKSPSNPLPNAISATPTYTPLISSNTPHPELPNTSSNNPPSKPLVFNPNLSPPNFYPPRPNISNVPTNAYKPKTNPYARTQLDKCLKCGKPGHNSANCRSRVSLIEETSHKSLEDDIGKKYHLKRERNTMDFNGLVRSINAERRLEGKVALITGAAQGIGKAIAIMYSQHGAKVVIADIQDDKGYSVCQKIGLDIASFIHCDVSIEDDVKNAVDHAIAKFGKLDIMFNNAAIQAPACPRIGDSEVSDFQKVFAVNCTGVFLGIKHAARVMIPRKQGSILISGSLSCATGGYCTHAYTASKHAIIGLMKNTAAELGQFGIRVNTISSFLIASSLASDFFSDKGIEDWASELANLKGAVLGANDIAKAAIYFGSDDSNYVSGHNFIIDGGITTTNGAFGIFNYN
ncbi:hypothetical protein GIB67_017072 [Kingdonia uniflora]|uniref:Secoisolariciresinol dehydrogenase n=1 Tax=Kingdonia uniflora TaxID=39325 RepID=A0A7J7NC82_9MAGN|nr:hypothetical protein GIB67_017072 [Kingdonia uniflora]